MYDGYLLLGPVEILNRARCAAYLAALPGLDVTCHDAGLAAALGHSPYSTPKDDGAPWFQTARPASARFYGIFPTDVQGIQDSTRTVTVTELTGDGAALTSPRYGSRQIRFLGTMFAADEEAMDEGLAWLKMSLAHEGCSGAALGCTGQDATMLAALPEDDVAAYNLFRTFYRVESTEGPLITKKVATASGVAWDVEFTLTAGISWPFTSPSTVGTLNMDTGVNWQDPAGEDCSAAVNAYDEFIADPYFTAISRPPRAAVVLPPNLLDITSWRRASVDIPSDQSQRWGRVAPVVSVSTEAAAQYLRLRFYTKGTVSGCGYDGEFLVSYIPANSVLTLDARKREATMTLPDGRVVPAGHLLFGSGGRPFLWPTLGCQGIYTLVADLMPGQAGVVVVLETAVRL